LGHDEPPDYSSTFKNGRGAIAANPGGGAMDRRSGRELSISASASEQTFRLDSSVIVNAGEILQRFSGAKVQQ
jgi:hypothetical protein